MTFYRCLRKEVPFYRSHYFIDSISSLQVAFGSSRTKGTNKNYKGLARAEIKPLILLSDHKPAYLMIRFQWWEVL